jgi:pimeloyl-ACP methyl ester carboxylesterase
MEDPPTPLSLRLRKGLGVAALALFGATLALTLTGFLLSYWQGRRLDAQFPPEGRFVDVDGVRLHYVETLPDGAARATVLLVHGASGNERDLRVPLAGPLAARGLRVISIDRPGHGHSGRGREAPASPAAQARMLRAAMEALGAPRAIVVGHSLAGALASNLAIDHGDFVAGLVLLAPVTHPWPGGVAFYYRLTAAPVVGWLFSHALATPLGLLLLDEGVRSVFAPQAPPADYAARTGVALVLRPRAFLANAQDVDALYDFVTLQSPRMGEIVAPVAIVSGDRDEIVLTDFHSRGSARAIAGATLAILKGVGHSPHWSAPQASLDAILDVAQRAQRSALMAR